MTGFRTGTGTLRSRLRPNRATFLTWLTATALGAAAFLVRGPVWIVPTAFVAGLVSGIVSDSRDGAIDNAFAGVGFSVPVMYLLATLEEASRALTFALAGDFLFGLGSVASWTLLQVTLFWAPALLMVGGLGGGILGVIRERTGQPIGY